MGREMFGEVVERSVGVGARKWYSVPLSVLSHVVAVGAIVFIPIVATDVLPTPQSILVFAMAPPPPIAVAVPPPPAASVPVAVNAEPVNVNAAPLEAPTGISVEPDVMLPAAPALELPARDSTAVSLAAPPAQLTPPPSTRPVPVGGAVGEPRKTHHVAPVYPPVARAARRSGMVILEATIGRDGSVREARVLRSDPMFDTAALDAVKQWRYTTPTLNNVPIDVTMTVTVRFTLQ